jgi:hypothetical protein
MKFGSLDLLIQSCEAHLDSTGSRNTDIENYFVQFLLVRICAEYESRVITIFNRRCARPTDAHIRSFAQKYAEYKVKRFSVRDICQVLELFGTDYKDAFHKEVMSGASHAAWDNIYTNRQGVAHQVGTQMSLGDLKKEFGNSNAVLEALAKALDLRAAEVLDLK